MTTPVAKKVWARGPKIILLGLEGTGKTDSIRTLLEAGLKVFCVFLEPGMEVLTDPKRGKVWKCEEGLHWKYIPVAQPSFKELMDGAKLLNTMSYKALSEMSPMNREKYKAFYHMLECMSDLHCDRCGQRFGPADQLPYDEWAIVNDSLTSISKAAMYLHIGSKPSAHEGEYGNAMRAIESYVDKFTTDMPCMGIMLSHIDKEPSPETGGMDNMVSTLGKKLAPKIPRPFSDVVLARRDAAKFTWSTIASGFRLKTRNFPFSNDIPPTFAPVVRAWQERIKAEEAAASASAQISAAIASSPQSK